MNASFTRNGAAVRVAYCGICGWPTDTTVGMWRQNAHVKRCKRHPKDILNFSNVLLGECSPIDPTCHEDRLTVQRFQGGAT